MDLRGGSYVVAGGAGVVGEAVTRELLRLGATVTVPSRSSERLARLRSALPEADRARLHTLTGDVGDPAGVLGVRDRVVASVGRVDGVVASLGGWWEGPPLTEIAFPVWQRLIDDNLTAHFLVAQAFLPVLRGTYVALNGIAAFRPVPFSGPVSVADAALTMLLRTFAAELTGSPVRIHEVAILTPIVTRHWPPAEPAKPHWLTGEQVAGHVAGVLHPEFPSSEPLQLRFPADCDIETADI
ncbi:NAD(P)-dependent dehydrogenase (short-subunit alcohol dehydrogenase family) [Amycolatopsis lexingtonensis]|uniref:NAD(P)-dependent dehydrogenase (Short-subunit alcohol dehydrogenase family) n=1 Tax=Amycolatopsis lexingtonensis TaxID=218822 RepID=A0ABR9IF82_9PSEU|nr:SDR family oxidoreductase [Amycolatopsis lexingtonensis]MBE1501843.1 NAD(P)-dependent dehydrogenase (short-subunit alcohol dehydrogenase family) [Amycolatopsis lexingtonensis]